MQNREIYGAAVPFFAKKRPGDAAQTAACIAPLAGYGEILVFLCVTVDKSRGIREQYMNSVSLR